MKNKLILFFVVILAITLRFYQLGQNPPSLDWDEASLGYNAYSLLRTGKDEYGNSWPISIRSFNDYKPPIYTYIIIPSVALFGLNEFSVRLPSAILGVIAVVIIFFISDELLRNSKLNNGKNKYFSYLPIIAATILCISPWHLQFSRVAFEANVALTFFMIAVLYLLKAIHVNSYLYYLLSSLFFILTMYTYHSSRLLVPIFLLLSIFVYFNNIKNIWKTILPAIFTGLLLLTPLLISLTRGYAQARFNAVNVFSNPGLFSREAGYYERQKKYFTIDKNNKNIFSFFHHPLVIKSRVILRNYFDHANLKFLFLTGDDVNRHGVVGMGLLYFWEIITLPIGIFFIIKHSNRDLALIFSWLIVSPLAAAFTTQTPHAVRSLLMLPPLVIFSAMGLITLFQKMGRKFAIINILVILLFFYIYLDFYYLHTPIERSYSWLYGYKQVIQKMNEIEPGVDEIIFTTNYDQPYIYILFYNQVDPIWYQKIAEEGNKGFGKIVFRPVDIREDLKVGGRLIIASPKEMYDDIKYLNKIDFLDGKPAFYLVKT